MRSEKGGRTLICYAGSASEASIGSKPIGSELVVFICILIAKSQHFVDWVRAISVLRAPHVPPHGSGNKRTIGISLPCTWRATN